MLSGRRFDTRNVGFAPVITKALMIRIATLMLVLGGTLVAGPALAQFGNLFGDAPPPRPPADIPNGPFPQQPPPPQYPQPTQPAYPGQAPPVYSAPPPQAPTAIETQPLPPPRGAPVAPPARPAQPYPQQPLVPTQRAVTTPPPANPSAPPPAAAPPPDDTVVERPTPHIDNRRATFAGLDKITGRTTTFDAAIGETVQFGALQVTPRACYTRPPTEATNTDAFVEVDEVTLQGEIKRIFTGWMFASSPGLNAVEHPIYDVWLTGCASPIETSLAEPAPQPAAAVEHHPAPRQRPAPRSAVQPQPR
jgi:hypothetical protein